MSLDLTAINGRENDFNDRFKTSFSYAGFIGKIRTAERLNPENAANEVYKGTLGSLLKDALIISCNVERNSRRGESPAVDLYAMVADFEDCLMKPFVNECKKANEKPYPAPYGGMTEEERIEIVEHIISISPKNDAQLVEEAYKSGNFPIRQMREYINDMPFAEHGIDRVTTRDIQMIGAFMLALENANKSRSILWKILHPIRNNAEQREAKEMTALLNSFGDNALENAKALATKEYNAISLTVESIKGAKAELEKEKSNTNIQNQNDLLQSQPDGIEKEDDLQMIGGIREDSNQMSNSRNTIKVVIDSDSNSEVSQIVDEKHKVPQITKSKL